MSDIEKGKFRKEQAKVAAEEVVDHLIHQIMAYSKNLEEGRKQVQAAKQKIQDVAKRVQKDPTLYWDYVPSLFKVFDYVTDMGEKVLESESLEDGFKKCIEVLKDKLEEERDEAEREEKLKL